MKRVLLALPILLGGCSTWLMPSADQLNALAKDQNPICINLTTPWGAEVFNRIHGCEPPGPSAPPVVVVTPGGASSHVQVIQPQ